MLEDIKEVLFSKEQLEECAKRLGEDISRDYEGKNPLLIGVLKGSVVFMTDLMRAITIPCEIDFMAVSSYGCSDRSSGAVKFLKDLDTDIAGRDLIIVEDILDTGLTLTHLTKVLSARNAASIKLCVLLDKEERREVNVPVAYRGFFVKNEFVVGYGLDYAGKYRNLPYIGVLKREIYENSAKE